MKEKTHSNKGFYQIIIFDESIKMNLKYFTKQFWWQPEVKDIFTFIPFGKKFTKLVKINNIVSLDYNENETLEMIKHFH